jgi:hypothetical protein
MTTTLGAHTLCFWTASRSRSRPCNHRTRRGPRSLLIISIAALRYHCTVSYLRVAERCTIKSTYIHLNGHEKRGVGNLFTSITILVFGMAWTWTVSTCCRACLLADTCPLLHTGVDDAPVLYSSILCSHCLGIPMESAAMIPTLAQFEHDNSSLATT